MSSKYIVFLIFTFSVIDLFKHYNAFSCDFDSGSLCSWIDENTKLKWTLNTPFKARGKMPKFDHSLGNYQGRYVYLKGDDNTAKEGTLTNTNADASWKGNFCVGFWYFMNVEGKSNSLKFQAEHDVWWSTESLNVSSWKKTGNLGYKWRHVYVHVISSRNIPKVRFLGNVQSGIIAIDDIKANSGSCPPSKMCTFDDDDYICGYSQDSRNNFNWVVKSAKAKDTLVNITDHTTRSIEGKFLYLGIDGMYKGEAQRSLIYSPNYPASESDSCVTFYYHIYNVSKLTLNTYVASHLQLSASISQGVLWHGARFTVKSRQSYWQIVFEVVIGNAGYGQVAIDDITVINRACDDPGACDFEKEDCLWENIRAPDGINDTSALSVVSNDIKTDLLNDDFDWTRHIGWDYFGPARDHTLDSSQQGFYSLLDTRYTTIGEKAVYMSERLRTASGVCLKFWYAKPSYPNGATLQVFHSSNFKTAKEIKLIKQSTNEEWTHVLVSVIPTSQIDSEFKDFWIFLSGKNIMGYIAIDDISISEGICEAETGCEDFGGKEDCLKKGYNWTCKDDETGEAKYSCVCISGYKLSGDQCIENFGCEHNGGKQQCDSQKRSCINKVDNRSEFECGGCFDGYKDENDICIDLLAECNGECLKKGERWKCVKDNFEFKCACKNGFTKVENECLAHCTDHKDCLNGAYCRFHNHNNGFFCHCKDGFKGDNCEINEYCANKTCGIIGATCHYVDWLGKAFCICPPNKHFNRDTNLCEEDQPTSIPTSIITMTTAIANLLVSMAVLLLIFKKLRNKT